MRKPDVVRLDHGRFPVNALFVLIIAALALVTIGLSGVIVVRFAASVRAAAEREMARAAGDVTFALEREIANATNVLTALKGSDRLHSGDIAAFHQTAVAVARDVGIEFVLRDLHSDEQVLNTAVPWGAPLMRGIPFPISGSERRSFEAGRPILSDVFFGPVTHRKMVAVLMPIGAPGAWDYSLAAVIGLDRFAALLSQSRLESDWVVTIMDRKGTIVARSRDNDKFAGELAGSVGAINSATDSGYATGPNREGLTFVWAYRRSEVTGWIVGVGMPSEILEAPLVSGIVGMLVIGVVVVLAAVFVGFRASGPVARRFYELRDALTVMQNGGDRGPRQEPAPFVEMSRVLAAATAELLAVEDRRRYIQSAAEVGVWQWDLGTNEETWTARYRQIIGAPDDVVPSLDNFLAQVHPHDRGATAEAVKRNLATGESSDWECRIIRADNGEERWIHFKARVERDGSGRPLRSLGVAIDVTARNRAAQQIEDSAARLRALVETVTDGVMLIDAGGDVILFNPACERLFGYPAADVVGRNISMLIPPQRDDHDRRTEDFPPNGMLEIIGGGREVSGRRRDGTPFPLTLSVGEVKRDGQLLFVGIIHDLTAHKAEQRERDDLRRRLMEAHEQERQRLARELHDETGQLLTAALMEIKNVERLVEEAPRGRLRRLRADLEDMGRSLHRFAWELRPTSLEDLGLERSLANYLADWSARSGLHVDFHCKAGALAAVPSEVATHIYRIVQEALTNVIKHATGAAMVSVVVDRDRGRLQLTIEDDGGGFAADAAGAASGRLGLAGIRERLSLIAGQLEIKSTPGHGATLFIRIDIDPHEAAA